MKFELFLAFRYFKGNRKGAGFLSFIKIMAITGVAIGSAGLLIALSIVHGFKSTINSKILGFAPHISIVAFKDAPLYRADTLYTFLDQYPEIEHKQLVVEGQVMIQTRNDVSGTIIKGVDLEPNSFGFGDYLVEGEYNLDKGSRGFPGIILGVKLARQLEAGLGSIVTVYSTEGNPSAGRSPEIQQFEVKGLYQTGIEQFDDAYAITGRAFAQKLFKLEPEQASLIEIKTRSEDVIATFTDQLNEDLPFQYAESIFVRYANIYSWLKLQESLIPLVISIMIVVAAFNLIGAVLMMVLERAKDVGILKTMGSKSSMVRRIFLMEGLLVAVAGLAFGIGISLLFTWLQSEYQLIPLSEENYYMSYAPVEPHAFDFIVTALVTLLLCALASWLPARIAAKTNPLKVIAFGR
ncbi:MAG: ABC transporter permease [Bacteroidota bacterium]